MREKARSLILHATGRSTDAPSEAAFESVARFQTLKSVRSGKREGVEARSAMAEPEFTLYLDDHGILEFKPGKARKLVLSGMNLRDAMVPALIGTDFLYDPKTFPPRTACISPRTCCWAWSRRRVHDHRRLAVGRSICRGGYLKPGGAETSMGSSSNRLRFRHRRAELLPFLHRSGRVRGTPEPLLHTYLEKETVIGWKWPFEAKWLGGSTSLRTTMTCRSISLYSPSGSGAATSATVQDPVRFDDEKTVIHFVEAISPPGRDAQSIVS